MIRASLVLACACLVVVPAFAEGLPDTAVLLAAERDAMKPLAAFEGTWRGPATIVLADGRTLELTQTERVGPMLGGALELIEGRSYAADGSSAFNALAVISFAPQAGTYRFASHAQGYAGDFPLEVRPGGFSWSIPAGPATLRFTATVADGVWSEIGERIVDGEKPVRTFEMKLRRVGDTDWPAGNAVPAR